MKLRYLPLEDRQNLRVLRHTKDKQLITAILESIFRRPYYTMQTLWEYRSWFYSFSEEELKEHPSIACGLIQIHIHAGNLDKAKEILELLPPESIFRKSSELLIPGTPFEKTLEIIQSFKDSGFAPTNLTLTGGRPTIMNGIWDITPYHEILLNNKEKVLDAFRTLFNGSENYIYEIMLAEILYQQNKCYDALIHVVGAIPFLRKKEHMRILFVALTLQMYILIMNDQAACAETLMEDLKQQLHHMELDEYLPNIDALEAWSAMYDGDYAKVMRWMRDGAPDENKNFCVLNLFRYMIKMRAYIIMGSHMAVTALSSKLLPLLEESKRYMDICELCLIRAMSDRASGRTNEALDRLAYALELAEKYRYDRLIADECGRMHALLTLYKKERGSNEYLERVIKLAEETTTHHPKYLKEQSASHPPLTEAEKKVIRLLAAGYSNSEISDLLGIAVDTVKQHCRHIFAKLEVSSRTAAVAKAAELGIIDNISTTKK